MQVQGQEWDTAQGWLSRSEQPLSLGWLSPAAVWGTQRGSHGVVVPAGVWARALGRLAGVHVPLVAMHHAYVVTERIEGIQVSPAAAAPGHRGRETLSLPGTPKPGGPPHSCQLRLCSQGSAPLSALPDHPEQSQI